MARRVIVAGGGLAGLSCALRLHEGGARPLVLEASDGVGGRVRSDEVDGQTRYFERLPKVIGLVSYFAKELLVSNLRVLWDVFQRKNKEQAFYDLPFFSGFRPLQYSPPAALSALA